MRTRRWIRRFSVFKQLATGGSSAFMSSTTCSRSFSRQQRYVSPMGALPCLPARPRICLSILGPTKSRPMRQLCRITLLAGLVLLVRFLHSNSHTHRLIPAARLHVATQTSNVPASYAAAMRSLSSVVKPAYIVRMVYQFYCSGQLTSIAISIGPPQVKNCSTYDEMQRHRVQSLPTLDQLQCLGSGVLPADPFFCPRYQFSGLVVRALLD